MRFYEVNAVISKCNFGTGKSCSNQTLTKMFNDAAAELFEKSEHEEFFFFVDFANLSIKSGLEGSQIKACVMSCRDDVIGSKLHFPWDKFGITVKKENVEEIDSAMAAILMKEGRQNGFITGTAIFMLTKHKLINLWKEGGFFSEWEYYQERLAEKKITKKKLTEDAKEECWDKDLLPEFGRIEETDCYEFVGHPVHYMFCSDDFESRALMIDNLICLLNKKGRLLGRRYCTISASGLEEDIHDLHDIEKLYQINAGGTVVLKYQDSARYDIGEAPINCQIVDEVCRCIRNYRNSVLTILCFPENCAKEKKMFYEKLYELSFVELHQNRLEQDDIVNRLERYAMKDHLEIDDELLSKFESTGVYYGKDVREMYSSWKSEKIRKTYFPQYLPFETVRKVISTEEKKSTAYDELQEMIGLGNVKEVINKALNFYKVQRVFADKGRKIENPVMHMVFTGNPGTAKTTVARLFAQIMRDHGILNKGHLVEVGRADIVGKYVGHTAPNVKEAFDRAMGGVLFIDEAYSLFEGTGRGFGEEAIAAIVQEMENRRNEVIVIFAGYPEPMEKFLSVNPGLRSRIGFNVNFEDYTSAELVDITKLIAKHQNLSFSEDCNEKLRNFYDRASKNPEFGNGRYVRKMVEQAVMNQANRIVEMDPDKVTEKVLDELQDNDFQYIAVGAENLKRRSIGF